MRHHVAGRRLGRTKDQRRALRKNLITQLFTHDRIKTTEAKAKAVRGDAEKLVTLAKRGDLHARRLAASRLNGPEALNKLFDELAPRYEDRPGGYTRILRLGPRPGDSAQMVLLELVE
jgi:large subunit ribosomal protein L17